MDNGNSPAIPAIKLDEVQSDSGLKYSVQTECVGFTKREELSARFMAAMIGGYMVRPNGDLPLASGVSRVACEYADALLAEWAK